MNDVNVILGFYNYFVDLDGTYYVDNDTYYKIGEILGATML